METDYRGQILFVAVIAVLFMVVQPILRARTGKGLGELFFGARRGLLSKTPEKGEGKAPKGELRVSNGTKEELTAFIARLIRFAGRNKMRLVVPGSVRCDGRTATVTALLVTPARVIGIQCMGFGGEITKTRAHTWNQHINGQNVPLDSPVERGQEQRHFLQNAMDQNGISCPVDVVTVFTNPKVSFPDGMPTYVYTREAFFDYLKENSLLKQGNVDTRATSIKLAELAGIRKKT